MSSSISTGVQSPHWVRADIDIGAGMFAAGGRVSPSHGRRAVRRMRRPSRGSRGGSRNRTKDRPGIHPSTCTDRARGPRRSRHCSFQRERLIESEGAHREYLELEYAEGDKLFVPVENLDRVQKYLGGEGQPALTPGHERLDARGGRREKWSRTWPTSCSGLCAAGGQDGIAFAPTPHGSRIRGVFFF